MCVCVCVCLCVCMYVCMHACMHASMYVCMYVKKYRPPDWYVFWTMSVYLSVSPAWRCQDTSLALNATIWLAITWILQCRASRMHQPSSPYGRTTTDCPWVLRDANIHMISYGIIWACLEYVTSPKIITVSGQIWAPSTATGAPTVRLHQNCWPQLRPRKGVADEGFGIIPRWRPAGDTSAIYNIL
jgi:hypothetical protein